MSKRFLPLMLSMSVFSVSLFGCNTATTDIQDQLNPIEASTQAASAKNGVFDSETEMFKYMDLNKDGSLAIDEFKMFITALLDGNKDKDRLTKVSMTAYANADANKDNKLTSNEFKVLNTEFDKILNNKNSISKNSITSNQINPTLIPKMFNMMKDSSKGISEKAFIQFYLDTSTTADEAKKGFDLFDTNKDKSLSLDEFKKMFDQTNKNGVITDGVKKAAQVVGLVLLMPFAWLAEKLGLFHNIM